MQKWLRSRKCFSNLGQVPAATRDWWDTERQHVTLWVSDVTDDELEAGSYPRQVEALAMARRLRYLPMLREVYEFAELLVTENVVPMSKPGDALQMAVAAVHGVDYLLTWNYAHLANPVAQRQLERCCREANLRCPLLVSPETIPKSALGQTLRRKKDDRS
jgi:hypothetical protein